MKGRMENGGCSRNEGIQQERTLIFRTAPSKVISGSKRSGRILMALKI